MLDEELRGKNGKNKPPPEAAGGGCAQGGGLLVHLSR
jgi:hypothetical protein